MQRSEDISELDAEVVVMQNMQKAKGIPVSSTQPCNLAHIDNRYTKHLQKISEAGSTLIPSSVDPPPASRNALIISCETDPGRHDDQALPIRSHNNGPEVKSKVLGTNKDFSGSISSKTILSKLSSAAIRQYWVACKENPRSNFHSASKETSLLATST